MIARVAAQRQRHLCKTGDAFAERFPLQLGHGLKPYQRRLGARDVLAKVSDNIGDISDLPDVVGQ